MGRLTCQAKGRDLRLKRAKTIARTFQLVHALILCRSARRFVLSKIAILDRRMIEWNEVELKGFMESKSRAKLRLDLIECHSDMDESTDTVHANESVGEDESG